MLKHGIFEYGVIIISENSTVDEMEKTVQSIKKQNLVARKINIMSLNREKSNPIEKDWIAEKYMELKEIGLQEFKFTDIVDKEKEYKHKLFHVFNHNTYKPMPIILHLPDGQEPARR